MKASSDNRPMHCRSQGKHVSFGHLQFARLQGLHLHYHQQRLSQPEATQRSSHSSNIYRMEQLFLHSSPLHIHRAQPAPRKSKCNPRTVEANRPQNHADEMSSGTAWVSIGAMRGARLDNLMPQIASLGTCLATEATPRAVLSTFGHMADSAAPVETFKCFEWQHDADRADALFGSDLCSREGMYSQHSHTSSVKRTRDPAEGLSLASIAHPTCHAGWDPEPGTCRAFPLTQQAEPTNTHAGRPKHVHARQHVWTMQVLPSFACMALHIGSSY
jgi:hypothetical protein